MRVRPGVSWTGIGAASGSSRAAAWISSSVMASTRAQSVLVSMGGWPGSWFTEVIPVLFNFDRLSDGDNADDFLFIFYDAGLCGYNNQNGSWTPAQGDDALFLVIESVVAPKLPVRIFEGKFPLSEGESVFALVQGVFRRIPH